MHVRPVPKWSRQTVVALRRPTFPRWAWPSYQHHVIPVTCNSPINCKPTHLVEMVGPCMCTVGSLISLHAYGHPSMVREPGGLGGGGADGSAKRALRSLSYKQGAWGGNQTTNEDESTHFHPKPPHSTGGPTPPMFTVYVWASYTNRPTLWLI